MPSRRRGYGENANAPEFKAERLSLGGRLSPSLITAI